MVSEVHLYISTTFFQRLVYTKGELNPHRRISHCSHGGSHLMWNILRLCVCVFWEGAEFKVEESALLSDPFSHPYYMWFSHNTWLHLHPQPWPMGSGRYLGSQSGVEPSFCPQEAHCLMWKTGGLYEKKITQSHIYLVPKAGWRKGFFSLFSKMGSL